MKAFHTAALTLALVAMPGALIAQAPTAPVTARNQVEHLQTLFTPAATQCVDNERYTDSERAEGCVKAIAEIDAARKARGAMGVTEKANYDFFEALLQIALGHAYSQIDGKLTERACVRAERSWALAYSQMTVPKSAVDPEFYDLVQNPPSDIDRVLGDCRGSFGTPTGAPPLPAELKKKK